MKSLHLTEPHIIATTGIPGAGKTQFATQFAETFNAPLVTESILEQYVPDETQRNQLSGAMLKELMKTKQTLVFDGETDRRVERMELVKFARQAGYKVLFVWVQTDEATASHRSQKLGRDDETTERRMKRFSAPHQTENSLVISGKHTYSTQAKSVLRRLSEPRTAAISTHKTPVAERQVQTRPVAPRANRIHVS